MKAAVLLLLSLGIQADALTPMDQGYAELERAREELHRRLEALRLRSRGIRLPPADARRAARDLGQGYHLLRHPPLRAAFRDLEELQTERDRVDAADKRLDRIEALFDAFDDSEADAADATDDDLIDPPSGIDD